MTRDELYALVWSKPVTEVGLLVGMSGTGLAKACRRNGVHVPPRGYWARLAVGQVIGRAPPPADGHVETGVRLKGSAAPEKPDATRSMIRRRTAAARPPAANARELAGADIAEECARILMHGLRQQLRDAAIAYLAGLVDAIPTLDETTARAATFWVESTRSMLASASPADDAAEALRARTKRRDAPEAWLSALARPRSTAKSPPRRARHTVGLR